MWDAIGSMFSGNASGSGDGFRGRRMPNSANSMSAYSATLVAYPSTFLENKEHMEDGDKILLPHSALIELSLRNVSWPMTFKIENPYTQRVIHAGVLEFSAEEGTVYMPNWMMQNLLLRDGDIVKLDNLTLAKGQYVKLQPCSKTFIDIDDHRSFLEQALNKFSCLTLGELLPVKHGNTIYEIEVLELRPSDAVCIIETDLTTDFAAPKDWTPEDEHPQQNDIADPVQIEGSNVDPMPWLTTLKHGVRNYDEGFNRLVQEGRIPGVIRDRKLLETKHAKSAFKGSGTALGSRS